MAIVQITHLTGYDEHGAAYQLPVTFVAEMLQAHMLGTAAPGVDDREGSMLGADLQAAEKEIEAALGDTTPGDASEMPASTLGPDAPLPEGVVRDDVGFIVLPRASLDTVMQAKTRGELIEKINELLAPYMLRVATE